MCGFAGIYDYSTLSPSFSQDTLQRMGSIISHRGPDDEGIYLSNNHTVGFSFRRLSIIDLSDAGHQPMSNHDGKIWIVFNGEIYNHKTLRIQLESLGFTYRSRTDTETLLYAYEAWGARFIDRLEGMFSIALWDENISHLFLYRDRLGIKPLYYWSHGGTIVFGSEIKSLFEHPRIPKIVSQYALYHYLTFIHSPAPLTLFDGILKLEAGHFLTINMSGIVSNTQYWDPISYPPLGNDYSNENTITKNLVSLFESAVSKRMMSDVPFGVFLSGGIDSTANVAFMSKFMDRPVDTFTVAIRDQNSTNEFEWARRVAKLYGTNHHEVFINDNDFLSVLPTIVFHQDEPLADPVCFPLYYVSKLARDNGTIVLQVGEGSDEQFAGYESYLRAERLMKLAPFVQKLPGTIRSFLYWLAKLPFSIRNADYRQNILRNLFENQPVFWGNAIAFYETEKRNLISDIFHQRTTSQHSYSYIRDCLRSAQALSPLQQIIYWEMKNRLPELLLMRVDKITMANSIEARVPFLDHTLVEYSMGIPSQYKIKNRTTKYILKQALRSIIPDEIIDRKKIGFAGSGKNMLTPSIYFHAKRLLLSHSHGYFDTSYLATFFSEYERTNVNFSPQIWTLYNFELWHRYWIEGDTSLSL